MTPGKITTALKRLAPRLRPGGGDIHDLARLSGGASLETWAFEVGESRHGTRLILRRRETSAQASGIFTTSNPLRTEAALLDLAARQQVPIAPLVYVCEPEDGLGEAYIVTNIPGETRGRKIATDPTFARVRPLLAAQCGQILARIHAIPADAAPVAASGAYGELSRYEQIYRQMGLKRPVLELGFRKLERRIPPCIDQVVIHGDFRNGNLMVQKDRGIAAVLDWELSHLGDPAEDLGWLCVNSWRFGASDLPVGGFGDYDALLDAYAAESGRRIDLDRVLFWQAVGSLKWAVMSQMMVAAARAGEDRSLERLMIGRRTSEAELDLMMLIEILA